MDQEAPRERLAALLKLAHASSFQDPKEALRLAQEALGLAQALEDPVGQGEAFFELGWARYQLGEYRGALEGFRMVLERFQALEHPRGLADAHRGLTTAGVFVIFYVIFMSAMKLSEWARRQGIGLTAWRCLIEILTSACGRLYGRRAARNRARRAIEVMGCR